MREGDEGRRDRGSGSGHMGEEGQNKWKKARERRGQTRVEG